MIAVERITNSYGPVQALRGISFSIEKGEIVGLLGPNGAGKSTTMKVLTCYLPADSGSATVAGYDVFEQSFEVRKNIGYLPENNPVYTDMGIVEFLDYVGGIRQMPGKRRKSRIGDVIELCGLTRQVGKDIGQLSKGNRQRVGLAASLLHEPEVLILDEPTTGLDPNQIGDIRELIKSLAADRTVILSTHTLPEVESTCTRAIIINNGQVVADGPVEELRTKGLGKPSLLVTVKGDKAAETGKSLAKVAGVQSIESLRDQGGEFRLRAVVESVNVAEAIFDRVVAEKCKITELTPEGATLEEAFANLTR
jgi:ABC-2 type transport system ATP-binding protein